MTHVRIVGARVTRLRCALCHGGLQEDDRDARTCDGCQSMVHAECLAEAQACPTLGCRVPAVGKPVAEPERAGLAAGRVAAVLLGGGLGFVAFLTGLLFGSWDRPAELMVGPTLALAALFLAVGAISGAAARAVDEWTGLRTGVLGYWPYLLPLPIAGLQVVLAGLLVDSLRVVVRLH